ncbi:MAG TPA: lactonase family protein [Vicinamibacterales bacterium]|nr:lactonase family protein [Vicinamibacterales bacterium]
MNAGKLAHMRTLYAVVCLCLWFVAAGLGQPARQASLSRGVPFYVGTYTDGASKGIYRAVLDPATGQLSEPVLAAEGVNPSFLAWHPSRPVLYAVSETSSGPGKAGFVLAFAIEPDGRLKKINEQPSGGPGPCFVSVTASGSHVLVANYDGGSVASFAVRADGGLEPAASVVQHEGSGITDRQKGPHAHSIVPAPGGRFFVSADLGIDRVLVYALDRKTGRLAAHVPPSTASTPGAGPRHVVFHPAGDALYVINELASNVSTYGWDGARGVLTDRGVASTLPESFTGFNTTAEVTVHPSGKFVYGSNRGHDSIAVFRVNADRTLTRTSVTRTGGRMPRHFAVDPSGHFLLAANQRSNSITVFRIDQATGALTTAAKKVSVGSPVCVRFGPGG